MLNNLNLEQIESIELVNVDLVFKDFDSELGRFIRQSMSNLKTIKFLLCASHHLIFELLGFPNAGIVNRIKSVEIIESKQFAKDYAESLIELLNHA